jgi:hypothetical protein
MEPVASRYALALTKIANESKTMQAYLDACQQLLQLIQTDSTWFFFKSPNSKSPDAIFRKNIIGNDWNFTGSVGTTSWLDLFSVCFNQRSDQPTYRGSGNPSWSSDYLNQSIG